MPLASALRAPSYRALPTLEKGSNKVTTWRWIFSRLSALAITGLLAFHGVLLAGRLADASIAHPEVLAQWIGAALLGAGAWALRRQGASLVSGRSALVFWLLVLMLHVGFGSGVMVTGGETGSSRELLLLVPFAAFAICNASGTNRSIGGDAHQRWALPRNFVAGGLRFPLFEPSPAASSAGAGPERFSPRPPPVS